LAVTVMVLILLLVFALPLSLGISTIAANADDVVERLRAVIGAGPPELPKWIERLPLIGPRLLAVWNDLMASGVAGLQAW
jgi:predicted PurR-regulated permease PerM